MSESPSLYISTRPVTKITSPEWLATVFTSLLQHVFPGAIGVCPIYTDYNAARTESGGKEPIRVDHIGNHS